MNFTVVFLLFVQKNAFLIDISNSSFKYFSIDGNFRGITSTISIVNFFQDFGKWFVP